MGEWLSYRVGDLLMFSPEVYFRVFERFNGWLWPAQIPALLLGAGLGSAAWAGGARAGRWAGAFLGTAWLFIAWAFFARYYAEIFLAAPVFAAAFAFQGLLLIGLALAGRLPLGTAVGPAFYFGLALLGYALLIHPLVALMEGRGWSGVELFLMAPDPTAVGTLGLLLTVRGRNVFLLSLVPLLWCLVSGATYWVMGSWSGLAAAVAAALGVVVMVWAAFATESKVTR